MTRKTVPRRQITSKGCERGTWLTGKLQQICWHHCVSSPVMVLKGTFVEHEFANSTGPNRIKLHWAQLDCIYRSCMHFVLVFVQRHNVCNGLAQSTIIPCLAGSA